MLRATTDRDLSVELFGITFATPVFLAPIGVIGICTQDGHGDLAAARAAAVTGVPMVASTLSEDPLEAVAAEFGETPGFFQLYCPTDPEVAASLVQRAEAAGYRAIVVTLNRTVRPVVVRVARSARSALGSWRSSSRKRQTRNRL